MKFSPPAGKGLFPSAFGRGAAYRSLLPGVGRPAIVVDLKGDFLLMLQLILATLVVCAEPGARAVTFDEAKADPSKRMEYLKALLDPKVFDKAKNPAGLIKAWYYVADEKQMAEAQDAIKAVYVAEKREFFFDKEVKNVFAPLESPSRRATPWYSDRVSAGNMTKSGILLVGDVFGLAGEDELKGVVEDYALGLVKLREDGLKVGELELDAN